MKPKALPSPTTGMPISPFGVQTGIVGVHTGKVGVLDKATEKHAAKTKTESMFNDLGRVYKDVTIIY